MLQRRLSRPPATACTCASPNAGSASRPPSSTTRVPGPVTCLISSSVPTTWIRPPRTARAWTNPDGCAGERIFPPVKARSAWPPLAVTVPTGRPSGVDRREHEDRDRPGRLLLVLGVVRPRRHGPLPPGRAFGVMHLTRLVVLLGRPVLQFHVRVGGQVVVPDGVARRAAQRRHHGVLAVVLDAHQRRLADLPRPRAHRRQDDHWPPAQVRSLGPAGPLVEINLVARPRSRAWLVFTGKWHASETQPGGPIVPGSLRLSDPGISQRKIECASVPGPEMSVVPASVEHDSDNP